MTANAGQNHKKVAVLSVNETLGAVYLRPGTEEGPKYALYRRANPKARPTLYKIIEGTKSEDKQKRRSSSDYRSAAFRVLGYIGTKKDAKKLETILNKEYEGVLTEADSEEVRSIFEALGIMYGRDIQKAGDILEKMLSPKYWDAADFRWRSEEIDASPPFAYESIAWAMRGYSLSGKNDLKAKVRSILNGIPNDELRKYMEWRINADRLEENASTVHSSAQKQVSQQEKEEAASQFNGDLKNPGPAKPKTEKQENAGRDKAKVEMAAARFGTPSPEDKWVALKKGDVTEKKKAKVIELAQEAKGKYQEIREAVVAGDMRKVAKNVLDDGNLLEDENAAASPEFQEGVSLEQKIFESLAETKATPGQYRVSRTVDYAFKSTEASAEEIQERVIVRFQFRLEGSKEIAQQFLKNHPRTRTVSDDGNLIVVMKKIDGQWYWNPFGW